MILVLGKGRLEKAGFVRFLNVIMAILEEHITTNKGRTLALRLPIDCFLVYPKSPIHKVTPPHIHTAYISDVFSSFCAHRINICLPVDCV